MTDDEIPDFVDEEVQQLDVRLVEHQIHELDSELAKTDVNLTSVYQYRDKMKELHEKEQQLETIVHNRNTVR